MLFLLIDQIFIFFFIQIMIFWNNLQSPFLYQLGMGHNGRLIC